MGIMSDRTKSVAEATIMALTAGLELAGQGTFAKMLKSSGMAIFTAGYDYLGMTDEVTVNAEGPVTGEITK